MSAPVIETRDLARDYPIGDLVVHALRGVSVTVQAGEFVGVMGPSGSGKSTFMNLLGCLDRPTAGWYRLEGRDTTALDPDALAEVRNRRIGFVFQQFNLLARTTALENVELPLLYGPVPASERRRRARAALAAAGLANREHHYPSQLSGGQQQRVAIARALVNDPVLLLADEPTGALDSRTSLAIMALLQALNRRGLTVVLVTHEPDVVRFVGRVLRFRDGRLVNDAAVAGPEDAQAALEACPAEAAVA